jgi:hypothetical protein
MQIMAPDFANPIEWWACPQRLLDETSVLPENVAFLHCYNEMWRRAKMDKNAPYPKDSILGRLQSAFEK